MRRFKFTLESVLTVRKKTLEDAKIRLASVANILNKQKEVLESMVFEYNSLLKESAQNLSEENFNPVIISNYSAFSNKLFQDIEVQKQIISKTELDLKKHQQIVNLAYTKVQALEKLKIKQKEKYDREIMMEEFKEIDDIVNSRRITA